MTIKIVLRGWRGRNSKSVEQKQVVAREKVKFKTKINRRRKKIKCGKGREEQILDLNYTKI